VRQHLFDTARPARSDNHTNLISYVVSEMRLPAVSKTNTTLSHHIIV
jgi:hypothetical protein